MLLVLFSSVFAYWRSNDSTHGIYDAIQGFKDELLNEDHYEFENTAWYAVRLWGGSNSLDFKYSVSIKEEFSIKRSKIDQVKTVGATLLLP